MAERHAQIFVEGRPYEVTAGQNLLQAALALGFDLPYFCWHPALGSVGACRQCAVKQFRDESDTHGKIVMACMTPAADGARISIRDPEAVAFRAAVIEWFMTNHPHDCPVCDEGGECHLQDMTQMSGHTYRRFRFRKRTFENQDLGPAVTHEMNRCIQCYRCARFYRDYAGGRDLNPLSLRNLTYFGRAGSGTLESPFSGNLVEVCPTGVFTDKSLSHHYTRKWDLQTAPSLCVHCAVGCNTIPGERYGTLRRIRNRYHSEINGYFLCDRGRYGYEFVNDPRRIGGEALLDRATELLAESHGLVGIGSPRASLEANFAVRRLVGAERFCNGMSVRQAALTARVVEALEQSPARIASLREIEDADAILVLGHDPTGTAPRVTLSARQAALRQAAAKAGGLGIESWNDTFVRLIAAENQSSLYVITPDATLLDDVARALRRTSPEKAACLGLAIAHEVDPAAPEAPGLSEEERRFAQDAAQALVRAARPIVISGTAEGSAALIAAAADIARALHVRGRAAALALLLPECNSLGVSLLSTRGIDLARELLAAGKADTLVVLENDITRRMMSGEVEEIFRRARCVLVLDHLETPTAARATLALPTAAFPECAGTLVNFEGRMQRFFQVYVPGAAMRPAWQWLGEMAGKAPWPRLADLHEELARAIPSLSGIRSAGVEPGAWNAPPIPRQSARYSGRTAMLAHLNVHEPAPDRDPDAPFAFSMEGFGGDPPAGMIPRYWAPGWNSAQALNKFQDEIAGPLRQATEDVRVIEPGGAAGRYYGEVPPAGCAGGAGAGPLAAGRGGKGEIGRDAAAGAGASGETLPGIWRLVQRHHVFGSEELSDCAPVIRARRSEPYLAVNERGARALGIGGEARVIVVPVPGTPVRGAQSLDEAGRLGSDDRSSGVSAPSEVTSWTLGVRVHPDLADGLVSLPAGYREQPGWDAVDFVKLRRAEAAPGGGEGR
jgi:NADH-quinone oxidoreductase subunit G